jgi:DNA-binding transcriptional LysR family regulator
MNVQDVDLNLLRVFDAVLRERGVTAAAAGLGLTQPAVSNALSRLRKLFGDALFVRTPAGMDATPFARQLAEPVRQALALLESALAHGPGFEPASSTRAFRFYMSDLGQIEFLPPLIERVQKLAPGVRLEAVALDVEDISAALAAGALAFGYLHASSAVGDRTTELDAARARLTAIPAPPASPASLASPPAAGRSRWSGLQAASAPG